MPLTINSGGESEVLTVWEWGSSGCHTPTTTLCVLSACSSATGCLTRAACTPCGKGQVGGRVDCASETNCT